MQTFLTRRSFHRSMSDLDDKRMINQFEEALHILRVHAGLTEGYKNHPAVKMWRGHEHALSIYMHSCTAERVNRFGRRWNKDRPGAVDPWIRMDEPERALKQQGRWGSFAYPPWWDELWVYMSHRSNLLRKDPEFYGAVGWSPVPELMPYLWPVVHSDDTSQYSLYISAPDAKRLRDGELFLPDELTDKVVYKCPN